MTAASGKSVWRVAIFRGGWIWLFPDRDASRCKPGMVFRQYARVRGNSAPLKPRIMSKPTGSILSIDLSIGVSL